MIYRRSYALRLKVVMDDGYEWKGVNMAQCLCVWKFLGKLKFNQYRKLWFNEMRSNNKTLRKTCKFLFHCDWLNRGRTSFENSEKKIPRSIGNSSISPRNRGASSGIQHVPKEVVMGEWAKLNEEPYSRRMGIIPWIFISSRHSFVILIIINIQAKNKSIFYFELYHYTDIYPPNHARSSFLLIIKIAHCSIFYRSPPRMFQFVG